MSLTLKLGSLAIRTLAKPLANYIKHNAREHERFRRFCINFAQGLHRIDIRLRLNLLQDNNSSSSGSGSGSGGSAAVTKSKADSPGKWDAGQLKRDAEERGNAGKGTTTAPTTVTTTSSPRRIRPLSDAKAIETGATFISEGFLFCVATSVIVFEYWRQRRKESDRRDEVSDRLEALESKIGRVETMLASQKPQQHNTVAVTGPTKAQAAATPG